MTRSRTRATLACAAAAATFAGAVAAGGPAYAETGSFYQYTGSTPLSQIPDGTVLNTRTVRYHVAGIPTPVRAVQLLYRSTDARGDAVANVTSVLEPLISNGKAVSYQSFYDSLNPADSPSRAIAGDASLGGLMNDAETLFIAPLLTQGYTVVVADTEGQNADFAAGPEYGRLTLDSMRAASSSKATGLNADTRFGMIGYSGGAIATDWAAALAPKYAPDINARLVGYTEGGLLVDPIHNLRYVGGSLEWAGITPMAVAGVARAYGISFDQYLNSYGRQVMAKMQNASIDDVLYQYPFLTWKQLVKPQYANPTSIPAMVTTVNRLNLGSRPSPTIPGFIAQGTGGYLDGTAGNKPGIGPGDGVMIAGDVRTLARQYCAAGVPVKYTQYNLLTHELTAAAWAPSALGWLNGRFAGTAAPSSCGSIAPGNSLAPATITP